MAHPTDTVYILSSNLLMGAKGQPKWIGLEFDIQCTRPSNSSSSQAARQQVPLIEVSFPRGASRNVFQECVAMYTHVPVDRQRFRVWHERNNGSFRPGEIKALSDPIPHQPWPNVLFLEDTALLTATPTSILLLIKFLDEHKKMSVVGLHYFEKDKECIVLWEELRRLVHKHVGEDEKTPSAMLTVYHEDCVRKQQSVRNLRDQGVLTLHQMGLHSGDIIICQRIQPRDQTEVAEELRHLGFTTALRALDLLRPKLQQGMPQHWFETPASLHQAVIWKLPNLAHCFNNPAFSDICFQLSAGEEEDEAADFTAFLLDDNENSNGAQGKRQRSEDVKTECKTKKKKKKKPDNGGQATDMDGLDDDTVNIYAYCGLLTSSKYMETLLATKANFAEAGSRTIPIQGCNPEAFETMLRYMYGLPLQLSGAHTLANLLVVANRFQVEDLMEQTGRLLSAHITRTNCLDMLQFAIQRSSATLREACITFAGGAGQAMCTSPKFQQLCKEHPDAVQEIVQAVCRVAGKK